MLTGIQMGGIALGSIGYSMLQTLYINPHNLASDGLCGYALQSTITDNVPNVFLLFAIFCCILTIISFLCLADKPTDTDNVDGVETVKSDQQYSVKETLRSYQ